MALICIAFSKIGAARKAVEGDRDKEGYFWLLFGSALFSHIVAFFGISYFDQTRISWFALLAIIVTATAPYLVKGAGRALRTRSTSRLTAEACLRFILAASFQSACPSETTRLAPKHSIFLTFIHS